MWSAICFNLGQSKNWSWNVLIMLFIFYSTEVAYGLNCSRASQCKTTGVECSNQRCLCASDKYYDGISACFDSKPANIICSWRFFWLCNVECSVFSGLAFLKSLRKKMIFGLAQSKAVGCIQHNCSWRKAFCLILGKGENTWCWHFLLFSKALFFRDIKVPIAPN